MAQKRIENASEIDVFKIFSETSQDFSDSSHEVRGPIFLIILVRPKMAKIAQNR